MKEDEDNDRFPPRFKLKINCFNPSITLNFKYTICVQQYQTDDIHLQLIIFIKGRQTVQGVCVCIAFLHIVFTSPHYGICSAITNYVSTLAINVVIFIFYSIQCQWFLQKYIIAEYCL